ELSGLDRVVVAGVAAQSGLVAAGRAEDRGGPVGGRGAGAPEDGLGDLPAVDRNGQAGADLARAAGVPPGVVVGKGEGLQDAGRRVDVAAVQVGPDVLELGGGHVVHQVEVAGQHVGVGGVAVGVDQQRHPEVPRLVGAGVAVPP